MGEGIEKYYKLPEDSRWLDNPNEIGGRDIDVSQIAYSLQHIVKDLYPINQVPLQIEKDLIRLIRLLKQAEESIDYFIGLVSQERGK